MNNLVTFRLAGEHQCKTGEVVRPGTKTIFIKERHTGTKKIHKVPARDVTFLLGSYNAATTIGKRRFLAELQRR